ncbi:ParB/RepB/Spo0J family partition protein (plasmid) [Streptomyces sp. NBC_00637]|uniref:ParB/RepB/Spo0J family partition protein n=1 Tax=Streptomyces sp. NBC_00637 TaxID=2903667 RepID=UPI002F9082EB
MESTDRGLALPTNYTQRVRIEALRPADSPRLNGVDTAHVQRLADALDSLPPILVHRPSMRIVDGSHRVAAAVLKGQDAVEVHYFDGPERDTFLRSVSANIAHGLPLSVADRKAASERILRSHADLSDRAIATCTGLDPKTVAAVRRSSTVEARQSNTRMGSDGKDHPLDRTRERLQAAELMASRPDLPLRAVAEQTGLSLGTAHDVRRRLQRGEAPVPVGRRGGNGTGRRPAAAGAPLAPADRESPPPAPTRAAGGRPATGGRSRTPLETLRNLAGDPSLRQSESGRLFLRWLHTHFVVDEAWRHQAGAVPPHCTATVADLALQCSDTWRRFAEDLTSRRLTDMGPTGAVQPAPASRN